MAALDWQLVSDQEIGNCYFFNRATGLSTWEAPVWNLPLVREGSSTGGVLSASRSIEQASEKSKAVVERSIAGTAAGVKGEDFEAIASVLISATDIHVLAQHMAVFFRQLFKSKQRTWARKLGCHIAFPVCTRDVVCRAFLYGERSQAMTAVLRRAPRMQAWMRWILPLFDRIDNGEEDPMDKGADAAPPPPVGSVSKQARGSLINITKVRLVETQAILLVVSMLHYSFRVEPSERFGLMLTEVQRRFESQGWGEVNCEHMGSVLKALLRKIARTDGATLKKDYEHQTWDKLLVLSTAAEEFVFFSPLFGHEVRPDSSVVGIHVSERGCADKELVSLFHDLVNVQLGVGNQAISSEIFQDPQAAKEYRKRKELLAGMGQFWSAANRWCDVLEKLVLPERENSSGGRPHKQNAEIKSDVATAELVELLTKRISRCKKKQAAQALQLAVGACKYYVRSFSEAEPRPKSIGTNEMATWEFLPYKTVLEQTSASCFHLRRLARTLESAIEGYNAFTNKVDTAITTEAKKCYFTPNYFGLQAGVEGLPKDGMPVIVNASSAVMSLTNVVAMGAKTFVNEMQTEVLNPLNELKSEYDDAAITFKMHCERVDKDYERERELLMKDHAQCERDFGLVNLGVHEAQKMFDSKAETKRILMAQRTVARFVRYEQLAQNFEQNTSSAVVKAFREQITKIQLVELKRITCTQVILSRFLEAFARFAGDQSPMFRTCVSMVEGINPWVEMECFGMKEAAAPPLASLPRLPTSSKSFLEKLCLEEHSDKATDSPAMHSPGVCACGTPVDFDFQFCIECGARVASAPKVDPLKSDPSDGSSKGTQILARMKAPLSVAALQGKFKTAATTPSKLTKSPERVSTLERPLKLPLSLDLKGEPDVKTAKIYSTGLSSPRESGSSPTTATASLLSSSDDSQSKQSLAALQVQQKLKARLEALEKGEAKSHVGLHSRKDSSNFSGHSRSEFNISSSVPSHTRSESTGSGSSTPRDSESGLPNFENESSRLSEVRCSSCGSALYSDSRFCVECGSPVVPQEKRGSLRPANPPPPSRKFDGRLLEQR